MLFGVLVLLALLLVMQLDKRTVYYSFVGAALTVSYPFMKRFFALPQFWLGAAFGWAVPMAFVATLGGVPRLGWLLFIVTVLWAAVYDTEYAMVDRDDDVKIGVQSTAIAFGDMDKAADRRDAADGVGRPRLYRPCAALRLAVLAGAGRRGTAVPVSAMADPQPRAGGLLQGLPEQQLGGVDKFWSASLPA